MSWKASFKNYAKKQAPNEACGLLAIIKGKETFWPCKNLAEGKFEFFILDPDDWADYEDQGEVIGIIHSHPDGELKFSETDIASCNHLDVDFYLVCPDTEQKISIKPEN